MGISDLAKIAVEKYIKENKTIKPPKKGEISDYFLKNKSGVFVTIRNKESGELRGCIGTYLPTSKNIAEETIRNAISAAVKDYRFMPVQEEELPKLKYEVSILSKPSLVKSIKELDPKKYGIIIFSESGKSALLLPNIEGIDNIEQQVSIACQKGLIDPEKENLTIYKFKAKTYGD